MKLRFTLRDLFWQPIRGSLVLSLALIFLDGIMFGGCATTIFVCSIWFFVALFRNALGHASAAVAWARVLLPVVTGLLVYANYIIQEKVALSNASTIIQACERYHSDNGAYPRKLPDLVPRYLGAIPRAKYSLGSDFFYSSSDETTYLMFWKDVMNPRFYNLRQQYWFGGPP
jgi:hypothetical protein